MNPVVGPELDIGAELRAAARAPDRRRARLRLQPWQLALLAFLLGVIVCAIATEAGRPRYVIQICDDEPGATWL